MDSIPYTVKPHPGTGMYNAQLGIWLFLASEAMLFGALFSTYIILRMGAVEWPTGSSILNIPVGSMNTIVLLGSSVTMFLSWAALKEGNFAGFKKWLGITLLCAIGFCFFKGFEYYQKIAHHHLPHDSTYLGIYFTMTGLHAIHVIGGLIVGLYFWGPGSKMWLTEKERFTHRIEVLAMYWYFVDFVWIFLFTTLYLL